MSADITEHEVAIHEAGHAVVAYAFGEQFDQISTEGSEPWLGVQTHGHVAFVNWFDPNVPLTTEKCERAERFVMILLAGVYTHHCWRERTLTTAPDQDLLARTANIDLLWIMRFTNSLGRVGKYGDDTHAIQETLWQHLGELVERAGDAYWLRVEALADAVRGGRTLSWETATAVLSAVEAHHELPPLFDSWHSILFGSGLSTESAN